MANPIVTIIVFIVIGIVLSMLLRFLRKTFKWFIFVWAAVVGFSLVFGFFLILDIHDLRENLPTKPKLIMFDSQGKVPIAFVLRDYEDVFGTQSDIVSVAQGLQVPNLEQLNSQYAQETLEEVREPYYKVFIISEEMFQNVSVDFGDVILTQEETIASIKAQDPKAILIEKIDLLEAQEEAYREQLGGDDAFRISLLLALFSSAQSQEGPTYLINRLQDGSLTVYEESITFKVLKYIPASIIAGSLSLD